MLTPQSRIFVDATRFHHYLEYEGTGDFSASSICEIIEAAGNAEVFFTFGKDPWRKLSPNAPGALRDFEAIDGGADLKSPATQYDLLFWFHAADYEDVLDAALSAQRVLDGTARLKLGFPGLVYRDSRDLTGFVDGSANPKEDVHCKAALMPAGEASAGSAFLMIQKWVHDLPKFEAVSVPDQDRIIGRTKPDSIELEGDAKPPDSHVSRTDVKLDGTAMKIYRRSANFGGECEKGLYFIAFSCDPMRFDVLLQRMFGRWKDELHDQLVHYSSPVSGSYWFAPSQEDLAAAGCTG